MRSAAVSLAALVVGLGGCVISPSSEDAPAPTTPTGSIEPVDSVPTMSGDSGTDTGVTTPPSDNLLANGGFESGETWWRPGGAVSHEWARTGDAIFQSSATFTALQGQRAQKIWGLYWGTVPNDSEHGLTLSDITPGDLHEVTVQAFTHPNDAVSGGSEARLFLRFVDAAGATLSETVSDPFDGSDPGQWQELRVEAEAPAGAVSGALGLRFSLAAWTATGSVYLDDASWISSGTGRVEGERQLVWNDEFDGTTLDETKWTRLELPAFTYNAELQAYTTSVDNSRVENGQLVITAREESNGSITSARLVTDDKAEFTYGRFEAMARVPSGVGTWPAFWMLPSDWVYGSWPYSGEIDIMEHVGCDVDTVHATVHTGAYNHLMGTQQGGSTTRNATAAMHLYAADWGPDEIVFTIDGEEVFRFDNDGMGNSDTWPFDQTFHLLLNLAFGGSWGGYCGVNTAALPQEFRIDWVRVYQ